MRKLERVGCQAEFEAWRAIEVRPDVFEVAFEVLASERHGCEPNAPADAWACG
jgi:hypothetical protein